MFKKIKILLLLLTAMGEDLKNLGHSLDMSTTTIITSETDILRRRIREAIKIQCQGPTLN